jgi:hypothetical protein
MIEGSNLNKRKAKIINLIILFLCIFAEQGKTCEPISTYRLNRNFNFEIIRNGLRSYKIPLFLQHTPAKGISDIDNSIKYLI